MLPAAVMVLMSVWEQLLSPKRTACQAMLFILMTCASGAAVCYWQGWVTNTLLLPFMALAFVLFRRALKPNVSVSQSILLFLSPATVAAVALMLSVCLNARREVTNVQPIYLLSTVLLNLGIESLLAIVYALVAEMAAARISGGTRVARCQPHPRYLHRVHHLHHAARPGDGAG